MRVPHIFGRYHPDQSLLDLLRRVAGCEAEPVADPEDVRVDRHGRLAECHVEHDIGGLAPDARQFGQQIALVRHLAAMVADQRLRKRNHVLRLVAPQADGADIRADPFLAERQHLFRRVGDGKQRRRRLVDAGVGGLRRKHDGDQQGEGVDVLELPLGSGRCTEKRRKISRTSSARVQRIGPHRARPRLDVVAAAFGASAAFFVLGFCIALL